MSNFGAIFTLCISLSWIVPANAAPSPKPSAQASVAENLGHSPSPSPQPSLTQAQAKTLLKNFLARQKTETKALEHRQQVELKELKLSQKVRRDEWANKENLKRREFFRTNTDPVARRNYFREQLERRKALEAMLKDELAERSREQEVRRKALKQEQDMKHQEFEEILGHGEHPPESLYPQ